MSLELRILKANHGDSIIVSVEFDNIQKHILIDGGPSQTFEFQNRSMPLKIFLNVIKEKNQKIDLLVLTHVDDDHIGGLLSGFNKLSYLSELTNEVWFNSGKLISQHFKQNIESSNFLTLKDNSGSNTSIGQGVKFEDHLTSLNIWSHELIKAGDEFQKFGCIFKVLSPSIEKLDELLIKWEKEKPDSLTSSSKTDYKQTFSQLLSYDVFKEDVSIHNGSSIAFILEHEQKSIMFLGDAHPSIIIKSLIDLGYSKRNKLKLDFLKVSHHGSKANTSEELLSLLDCNNFIISTDGSRHSLPNKITLARIIKYFPSANLMFNYPNLINRIFSMEELENAEFSVLECGDMITL
tara:strand:+ start:1161 stop:2210 length:1050 start_codon:yes stop_codon:yes gene_type:complete